MRRICSFVVVVAAAIPSIAAAQLQVVSTTPSLNDVAPVATAVAVEFDRALDTATVNVGTFRVFGQWSGAVRGTYAFSNAGRTVTLTPDDPFSAGESVWVNLSHDIRAADTSPLRAAGYAFQFVTATEPSTTVFTEITNFSNVTSGQTRIYGASAGDLDGDGWLDLATVNEVSADVRVFLNHADGSGLFGPMLPPQPIGVEASPNCTADFDNDGRLDLCVSATVSESVWILLGTGDGTFSSVQEVDVGTEPHGITALDADGDGDIDIVGANVGSNDLSLLLNDGTGTFGAATFFEGGVNGEYGLAAADMNGDGITDVVVGGRNGEEVVTMLGNGDGTFTAAGPPQDCGGWVWVVVLGDVNGDGVLDAATANDGHGTVGILLGQGDGTFAAPTLVSVGGHVPSVDLGDLDGDGDPDLVPSNFGGGFWRWYRNDGMAGFTLVEEFPAPSNPSCAVLFDVDNDGDLDMALTDEIANVVIVMENENVSSCTATPATTCRTPILPAKSKLTLKDRPADADGLAWKWTKGAATPKGDFGNPGTTDPYELCLYEDGQFVRGFRLPAGQLCGDVPCWKDVTKGFTYKDRERTPDGIQTGKLVASLIDGKASIKAKGKGGLLDLPDLSQLTGVLDVQLQRPGGGPCWGATYTPPFKKNDGATLLAVSDAPTTSTTTTTTTTTTSTTLPALWSAIHAQVIGPTCGGCHGGQGGLTGLSDCNTAHASLVDVASTELTTMDRVEPNDPTNSWLMHKLDGTQGSFTAQCEFMFCGSQMPLSGSPLSQEVRDAIRTWIMDGAVNDCP